MAATRLIHLRTENVALRSELAQAKADITRLREALDKIVAHTYEQTTSDIACAALAPRAGEGER